MILVIIVMAAVLYYGFKLKMAGHRQTNELIQQRARERERQRD